MSDRRVQHRQQRDTNTQEAADLKRENRNLRRQLARANREIERLQGIAEDKPVAEKPPVEVAACPKCKSTDLGEVVTPGGKTITSCKSCKKWRSRPT